LYYSTTASTAPTAGNLVAGELAINTTDGKLYYKDTAGVVQVIASKGAGSVAGSTTQVIYNNAGAYAGSANMTFSGTALTLANDASISGLTVGKGGGSQSYNTAFGLNALLANSSGNQNSGVGVNALSSNTTASNNVAFGFNTLNSNTTGAANTGIGTQALSSNTTASNNTALGYKAGYAITTGDYSLFVGDNAGVAATTGRGNTFVGSGYQNGAGSAITTGGKNTLLGAYTGNQGGLDIRTASNYIVLSDGDGNPRFQINSVGKLTAPSVTSYTSTTRVANTVLSMGSNGTGADINIAMTDAAAYNYYFGGYNGTAYVTTNNSGGVKLSLGATSWAADSDERFKNIKAPITNALSNLATLRTVYGNYKNDTDDVNRLFLIAQDVQKVYPEAVDIGNDEDKTLSLRAVDLIPVLVKAIQELNAKVTALEAQLGAK
jgi:hypothetical protein